MKSFRRNGIVCGLVVIVVMGAVFVSNASRGYATGAPDWAAMKKAAEQGDAESQYKCGVSLYIASEVYKLGHNGYTLAFEWFLKAAEQGYPEAQVKLGNMFYEGQGVPRDHKQAAKWNRKAAEQGHAGAQFNLGLMYVKGTGVPQDYKKAFEWYKKAAEQGYPEAQVNLGGLFSEGRGVPQSYTRAYAWFSLAAAQGDANATSDRNIVASALTPDQMIQAQELAAKIQDKIDHPAAKKEQSYPPAANHEPHPKSSGTGFIVTTNGYIMTCQHVVAGATFVKVKTGDHLYSAQVVRVDIANDLALLKIAGSFPALAFSGNRSTHMGQEVFTIGYPNPGLQGISPKLTKGEVNSLTGFQDDIRLYQVSVAVQPGNSGGPLLGMDGNVIGVIVAMLNAQTAFKVSGSLPQNVNYAVKAAYAQALLDTIPESSANLPSPTGQKSFDHVVDNATQSVVMVLSYKTALPAVEEPERLITDSDFDTWAAEIEAGP